MKAINLLEIEFDTPLGAMLAIADDDGLWLLEFTERRGLEKELQRLRRRLNCAVVPGDNAILRQIKAELQAYFKGTCLEFKTSFHLLGSDFQQTVWRALCDIPVGETCSYADLATAIGKPTAYRAVANANGCNQLAIIIPCHRVINHDGKLGGYGGGIDRKQWLIEHEANTV